MDNCSFISQLKQVLGKRQVLTNENDTAHYRTGFRSGQGPAKAVIFPETLMQFWKVISLCVEHDMIMIIQAANTGLTAGSTPNGDDYDREVVVINTLHMDKVYLLDSGKQIIGFPGSTLYQLERELKPYRREPHSVIGSSCIGASVIGGVANNSGGALVKRGPAYTELSLYAQLNKHGQLELVNHLGIDLGDTPEEILENLENKNFTESDIDYERGKASASDYDVIVRNVDAKSPARYNADPNRLFESSGCAGKIAVFAVRLDTFPAPENVKTYFIGTNNPDEFTQLRREILKNFSNLPDVAEYMHRDIYDIAKVYGKDIYLILNFLGTDPLPKLFSIKGKMTAFLNKVKFLPQNLPDRLMQSLSYFFPGLIPKRIKQFREKYEHFLIVKTSGSGTEEAEVFFQSFFNKQSDGNYFCCSEEEAKKAYLLRFAAAGAAIRYHTCHKDKVEDILALDIALQRNETQWVEQLPESIKSQLSHCLYYGHFLCHVFHQDYIVKKGADVDAIKREMLKLLDVKGAKYPAEHNVGHMYEAEPQLKEFYSSLDPTNSFNPGIGKTSKRRCCPISH